MAGTGEDGEALILKGGYFNLKKSVQPDFIRAAEVI
jgi:hypothetical protein